MNVFVYAQESEFIVLVLLCLDQVELPPSDLGAPTLLNKTLQLLQDILSSHDSSTITPEERRPAVNQVHFIQAFQRKCCLESHFLCLGSVIFVCVY